MMRRSFNFTALLFKLIIKILTSTKKNIVFNNKLDRIEINIINVYITDSKD